MALVLIVDDSPTDQHVLSQALQRHGFDTLVASEGKEAITLAEREHPDVVIQELVERTLAIEPAWLAHVWGGAT